MNCSDSASPLVCACVCHESCKKALLDSVNCEYKVGDTLTCMCNCYSVHVNDRFMYSVLYMYCKANQCTV